MEERKQEQIIETSVRAAAPAQLAYTLMGAIFIIGIRHTGRTALIVEYLLGVAVCVWLIYCRRQILCRLRTDDMVVTVAEQTVGREMLASLGRCRHLTVSYAAVAGVSADWRQLCLRNAAGWHSIVPVDWHELTPRDRGRILHAVGKWNDRQRTQVSQDKEET